MNNQRKQAIEGEAKAKPKVIKLSLDLHVRQVIECRQLDGSTPKPAQQWDPWKLLDQVKDWVPPYPPGDGASRDGLPSVPDMGPM
jgi:hypothetical protein